LDKKVLKFAVCGYGGQYNMSRRHANDLQATGRAELVAVCDPDKARREAAQTEFPGIKTFATMTSLLKQSGAEMVVIVTPHNTHAKLALQALKAGLHVVLEKPFCITAAEGQAMLKAAKQRGLALSCYHNRRWDGDFLTVRKLVESGTIGDLFSVQCHMCDYGMRTDWWRASKKISGGCLYDWGAHMLDWTLQLVKAKIKNVTGFSQKRLWTEATNEDEARAMIRFADGTVGDVMVSSLRRTVERQKWEIIGTLGTISTTWGGRHVLCTLERKGRTVVEYVPIEEQQWHEYHANLVRHILDGEELVVTAEQSARVIAVLEAQAKSAASGKPVTIAGG
jgi:scyllo-inositol 2-dehydrogenase (NADP+)